MEEFDKMAETVKNLKTQPNDEQMLTLYGLYKQVKFGDNDTAQPGFLDFKGKAKWKAWTDNKGVASADAAQKYVEFGKNLIAEYGLKE